MSVILNDNQPIITSLLDNDLYKFTMLQAMLHQFPQTHGVYRFRCRNNHETAFALGEIKADLEQQLDYLCQLKFTQDELDYLRGLRFIKSDFVDYLELFSLKRRFITVSTDENHFLNIDIEGPMIQAMFLRFLYFVLLVSCIIAAWQLMISWQKVKNDWMLRLPYCMSITPNKSRSQCLPITLLRWLILGHAADLVKLGNIMWSNRFMRLALYCSWDF